jgi:photosystem II stability/assembly factor-like uncharacterized protein
MTNQFFFITIYQCLKKIMTMKFEINISARLFIFNMHLLGICMNVIFKISLLFFFVTYATAQEINWYSLEGPMGGVIGDLAINEQGVIFAGMYPVYHNGLYKSIDNGDSWEKIETQFEYFAVYSIYITKAGYIWVGTDTQAAFYRSTDDGLTWENKNIGFNTSECWAIGESKDGVLFAGDADAGRLFRSTNGGDSWELSTNIAPLAFATDSNNTVYAGTFNGLYTSLDNGLTWSQNLNLPVLPISSVLIDINNNIYCGTGYYDNGNGVYYSNNGGQNWTQIGLESKVALSLAFDSSGNLYTGTLSDGLFKTSDLGQSWKQYQQGIDRKDVYRLKINSEDVIFIGSEGNGVTGYGDGGVFRSPDGGNSFDHIGLPVSLVKNIVFSGDSLIIAATPSGVQKYNRLTRKWNNLGLYRVEAVSITPSNYLYAATRDEGLYKSTDLGITWNLTNLTSDTLMSVYNVLAVNDDTLFASTQYNLRRSMNGGENWDVLPIKTGVSARVLFFSNSILWLTGIKSNTLILYKTNDYGSLFDSLFSGFYTFNSNNPLSVVNNEYSFLASRDNNLNGIVRSIDNGLTWEQILFIYSSTTVFTNDDGIVITGTIVSSISDTNKIYISIDFGETWISQPQPTDFGASITDVKQDQHGKYFIGTTTNGLYQVDIITSVEEAPPSNLNFYLSQNYPNPFNPTTKIIYTISNPGLVKIKVYNTLGEEIHTILNEYKITGSYETEFNGNDLPSGVYIYAMQVNGYIASQKMLLLK